MIFEDTHRSFLFDGCLGIPVFLPTDHPFLMGVSVFPSLKTPTEGFLKTPTDQSFSMGVSVFL
jgi:hypothetical protein